MLQTLEAGWARDETVQRQQLEKAAHAALQRLLGRGVLTFHVYKSVMTVPASCGWRAFRHPQMKAPTTRIYIYRFKYQNPTTTRQPETAKAFPINTIQLSTVPTYA